MTMSNNDMVALFPDIVACMEIPVLEIKKMYVAKLGSLPQLILGQVLSLSSALCSHEARCCSTGIAGTPRGDQISRPPLPLLIFV